MIIILSIITINLVMRILIIIQMMNYWSRIFKMKMIYRLMIEETTLTMKEIISLMMIISITLKRQLLMHTYLLITLMVLVKIGGFINHDELFSDPVNQVPTINSGELAYIVKRGAWSIWTFF